MEIDARFITASKPRVMWLKGFGGVFKHCSLPIHIVPKDEEFQVLFKDGNKWKIAPTGDGRKTMGLLTAKKVARRVILTVFTEAKVG